MTTSTPPSTPASSRPDSARGVLRKVDDYLLQHTGTLGKLEVVKPGMDAADLLVYSFFIFAGAAYCTWLGWMIVHRDLEAYGALYPFYGALGSIRGVTWAVQSGASLLVQYLVLAPLNAALHVLVAVTAGPVIWLVLMAPIVVFVLYPFFLWSNGSLPLAALVGDDLPRPVERFLDFALLPLAIQYFCANAAFFAPYIPAAYAFNAYVVLTSIFDLSPLRSLLSFCAALEDRHLNPTLSETLQGVTRQEDKKVAKLEREVEELKRALRVQGKTE